ncbi:unnamed protein product, partial [Rangifer tarandus platyrhynchus]
SGCGPSSLSEPLGPPRPPPATPVTAERVRPRAGRGGPHALPISGGRMEPPRGGTGHPPPSPHPRGAGAAPGAFRLPAAPDPSMHARPPCPSPTPGACSNSRPSSQ